MRLASGLFDLLTTVGFATPVERAPGEREIEAGVKADGSSLMLMVARCAGDFRRLPTAAP